MSINININKIIYVDMTIFTHMYLFPILKLYQLGIYIVLLIIFGITCYDLVLHDSICIT